MVLGKNAVTIPAGGILAAGGPNIDQHTIILKLWVYNPHRADKDPSRRSFALQERASDCVGAGLGSRS